MQRGIKFPLPTSWKAINQFLTYSPAIFLSVFSNLFPVLFERFVVFASCIL